MQLILENLKKSFAKKEVLQDVTGTFEQGTVYALLGRNGAGKTTLFTLIAGERSKDAGSVWIEQDGHKRPLEAEDVFFMAEFFNRARNAGVLCRSESRENS